jgi:hypothetical protein
MILTQNTTSSDTSFLAGKVTLSFGMYVEPTSVGWSTTNFTFQNRGAATSTVLEEPCSGDTRNFFVWFEQDSLADPLALNRVIYFDEDSGQMPAHSATGTLSKMSIQTAEPIVSVLHSSGGCIILKPTPLQVAVFRRVNELMDLAIEDEVEMSPSSFSDLWSFITARPTVSVPNVFALDNGNFRAVWKNSQGERVALEFHGGQIVGFVIFEYDHAIAKMMRMAGTQGVNRIEAQIKAARAGHLLRR